MTSGFAIKLPLHDLEQQAGVEPASDDLRLFPVDSACDGEC
jgi:hypothetical protein